MPQGKAPGKECLMDALELVDEIQRVVTEVGNKTTKVVDESSPEWASDITEVAIGPDGQSIELITAS
jgi:hypothetical protein